MLSCKLVNVRRLLVTFILLSYLFLLESQSSAASIPLTGWRPSPRGDDSLPSRDAHPADVENGAMTKSCRAANGVLLDVSAPISVVDPQFLSVTISVGNIRYNWTTINFTAPRILNMARALNPAMLRVGGTSGDYLSFNATTTEQNGKLEKVY